MTEHSSAVTSEAPTGKDLRDATFASLEGRASTAAARALTEDVYERVVRQLEHAEATGEPKANRRKLKLATEAFLADLLTASGGWVHRSLKRDAFTGGVVGATAFKPLQLALRELELVEHREGVAQFASGFGQGAPEFVTNRWAARYRATPKLIALAADHGITADNVSDHYDYGLPKHPLQKRAASTRAHGYKVQGKLMEFEPDTASRKLEADVRELNEFLAQQTLGGGPIHRGYVRIFQNGDAPHFNWDQGGRLYSQPATEKNYQQQEGAVRRSMTINGQSVVEIDLRASYLTIFHAWHGVQLDEHSDPYILPELGEGARDIVKLWVAASFGITTQLRKWPTDLREGYEEEHGPLDRKQYSVARLRELILNHHPLLASWGQPMADGRVRTWADLMFDESRIIVDTMLWLMRSQKIPSLAVHDSLIVAEEHQEMTSKTLKAVYWGHLKVKPQIKVSGPAGTIDTKGT